MDGVNPDMIGSELKYLTSSHLDLVGNCYWLLTDKSGKDACPGKGVYSFKASGRSLSFKKVSDSNAKCAGRRTVLAATFTKKFSQGAGGGY